MFWYFNSCSFFSNHYDKITILVMIPIMGWSPSRTANVAELITASTGHVVAALILLNHELALFALAVVKVVLKELYLVLVAQSLVFGQQTLGAESRFTSVANHDSVSSSRNDSFTVLLWAQFFVGIVGRLVELMYFPVVLLDVEGKLLKEQSVGINERAAVFSRAGDFLKHFDLINNIVM
jgi:hypothetical protein